MAVARAAPPPCPLRAPSGVRSGAARAPLAVRAPPSQGASSSSSSAAASSASSAAAAAATARPCARALLPPCAPTAAPGLVGLAPAAAFPPGVAFPPATSASCRPAPTAADCGSPSASLSEACERLRRAGPAVCRPPPAPALALAEMAERVAPSGGGGRGGGGARGGAEVVAVAVVASAGRRAVREGSSDARSSVRIEEVHLLLPR